MNAAQSYYPRLNLPEAQLRIRQGKGHYEVWCPLRRRFVALTPEEWVRQHFVAFLTAERGYPTALLGNEVTIRVGNATRRCDTILYNKEGGTPRAIVEYKAPNVPITQAVFTQISSYNSVLRAEYLFVSNGLRTIACHIDYATRQYRFLPDIPRYEAL
ncbi:MAG: type I restriction enzyme HsdR N-terminal domain-containing protein [Bacteroidaceae bacterium]|nr:type I restriction enzyme HsdR N-terminal domain-containing protein [Bacteroidaceae bacterium]